MERTFRKAQYLILVLVASLLVLACNPCRNSDCKFGSTCVQGECKCLKGYSGEKCDKVNRDKFLGSYTTSSESCSLNSEVDTFQFKIRPSSKIESVIIENFADYGFNVEAFANENTLEIPTQVQNSIKVSGLILMNTN